MSLPRLIGLVSHAPGCGKTSIARLLTDEQDYIRQPLAKPLKHAGYQVLLMVGVDPQAAHCYLYEDKHLVIPELGVTGRHLLQTLGTDWGRRMINPSIWINSWRVAYRRDFLAREVPINCVVDDVRFPDEADLIREFGGELWLVDRPGVAYDGRHASEGGLVGYPHFNRTIHNSGTLEDLHLVIRRILHGYEPN